MYYLNAGDQGPCTSVCPPQTGNACAFFDRRHTPLNIRCGSTGRPPNPTSARLLLIAACQTRSLTYCYRLVKLTCTTSACYFGRALADLFREMNASRRILSAIRVTNRRACEGVTP